MANTRKTTKYFRDILAKGFDEAIITDLLNRFGGKQKQIRIKTPFHWNHRINSVFISSCGPNKSRLCLDIYWQGDSTDGNDSVPAAEVIRKGTHVIPAVHFFECGRTYEKHSDISVSRDELKEAADALVRWLSPEEVKERKKLEAQCAFRARVRSFTDALYKEFVKDRWDRDERWYNGYAAVGKYAELHYEKLKDRSDDELAAVLRKVFLANRNYSRNLPKDGDGIAYRLDID